MEIKIHVTSIVEPHKDFVETKSELLEGQRCTEEDDIAQVLIGYYQGLFNTANPCNIDQAVANIKHLITPKMNVMLQEDYTGAKVDKALH